MKMELIQPFISATDAVLAETLGCSTKVSDVSMDEQGYRRQGVAALVVIRGDIEGRVILDLESVTAVKAASTLAGAEVQESAAIVHETVCELANMVIGNAVTLLNDQGFHFKVAPPEVHVSADGLHGTRDTEALVMSFDTPHGCVFLNIAMRYNRRRSRERATLVTD
jgi:chemotaxis protein CheX